MRSCSRRTTTRKFRFPHKPGAVQNGVKFLAAARCGASRLASECYFLGNYLDAKTPNHQGAGARLCEELLRPARNWHWLCIMGRAIGINGAKLGAETNGVLREDSKRLSRVSREKGGVGCGIPVGKGGRGWQRLRKGVAMISPRISLILTVSQVIP